MGFHDKTELEKDDKGQKINSIKIHDDDNDDPIVVNDMHHFCNKQRHTSFFMHSMFLFINEKYLIYRSVFFILRGLQWIKKILRVFMSRINAIIEK